MTQQPPQNPPPNPSGWRAMSIVPLLLLGMVIVLVIFKTWNRPAADGTPITADNLAHQAPSMDESGGGGGAEGGVAPDPVHWTQDFKAALAQAQQSGKPVLLDFTADWCPPCQALKRELYTKTDIREMIESRFVPMKIDLTQPNGPNVPVATRMGVNEIPALIALTPSGEELSRFSEDPTADNFRRWLAQMAAKGTRAAAVDPPHG